MIAATYTGWRPAGLILYLLGPGRHEEHRNPRVIAGSRPPEVFTPEVPTFDGAPSPAGGDDAAAAASWADDRAVHRLIAYLETGVREAGLPLRTPGPDSPLFGKEGYVWHTPARLHADDPIVGDAQWARIAHRLMRATGIAQAGCRWVAVRHADDHIHLAAILVHRRQGVWKRFHPKFWRTRLREECRRLENELGLTPTPECDHTAAPTPKKGEWHKAARTGREPARLALRRAVSQIASATTGPDGFVARLAEQGIRLRFTRGSDGAVRGYSVAWPGDTNAAGTPMFYAGSRLAPDLTWPKLVARWASAPDVEPVEREANGRVSPENRRAVLTQAARVVEDAATQLRAGGEDGASVAHATGELVHVLARAAEPVTPGMFTRSAEAFDRATRTPFIVLPPSNTMGEISRQLRGIARRLASVTVLGGRDRGPEHAARAMLALALASLIAEIGAWQHERGNQAQELAARTAVTCLTPADQQAPISRKTYASSDPRKRPPRRVLSPSTPSREHRARRYPPTSPGPRASG